MNEPRRVNPRLFWSMATIGIATMAYGLYGLFANSRLTHPLDWVRWFLGAAIAHDFVLAPVVAVVGVFITRRVPSRYRALAQGSLIAAGIVVLTAYPFLGGFGRRPDNPTQLPNNYWLGVLGILAVIGVVAGFFAWRAAHEEPERRPN